nr:MAG TPA_asm: hypothetical protein [Caudoviricetes sp.]
MSSGTSPADRENIRRAVEDASPYAPATERTP